MVGRKQWKLIAPRGLREEQSTCAYGFQFCRQHRPSRQRLIERNRHRASEVDFQRKRGGEWFRRSHDRSSTGRCRLRLLYARW